MVNQDPQPEIYSTVAAFSGASPQNTVISNNINTFQAANEEVRIYAVAVEIQNPTTFADLAATSNNFELKIQAGVNPVPTNYFDIGSAALSRTKIIELTCPVVIKFKQPLNVSVRWTPPTATNLGQATDVQIKLIGEIGVQKIIG
tara:strand:- start:34972 stop:35406 length:435 start_codon:yes stop_codon:yes gene_type:complete